METFFCNAEFVGQDVIFSYSWYDSGRVRIRLLDPYYFDCAANVTKNLPDVDLKEDEIIVPDYSEYKGLGTWLVEMELVKPNFRIIPIGYGVGFIFKISNKLKELLNISSAVNADIVGGN